MKQRRRFFFFLFCLMVIVSPFVTSQESVSLGGFDVEFNSDVFSKGDVLEIEGEGTLRADVQIIALNSARKVFSETVGVVNRAFSFSHEIGLLDPSGQWEIIVTDGNSTITKKISVNQTRESAFLAVSFLSPTPTVFKRTESVDILLRVTDAGESVSTAAVYFWDIEGNKINITTQEDGIYSYTYKLPKHAELGGWEIKAVAAHRKLRHSIGGESETNIVVEATPIEVALVNPMSGEFSFGSPFNLEVALLYFDGSKLADGNATAVFSQGEKSWEVPMYVTPDEHFAVTVSTEDFDNRVLDVGVEASDDFGNSTKQFLQFRPQNYFTHFFKKNMVFFILLAAFVIALFLFWYKKSRPSGQRKKLLRERQKIISLKKKNQKNYLVDRKISRTVFDKRETELEDKLRQAESRINDSN